ncbi:MAG: hypothetical protein V2A58_02980 [Planctomycetota bacterium]
METNLFFLVGADPGNAVPLGSYPGRWTDETDGRFLRYRCELFTAVNSVGDLEEFASCVANTLSLGPLVLVEYPRGAGRVVSFANSGGSLVNTVTGTSVASVFPESVRVEERSAWALRYCVTFVKAR